MEHNYKNLFDSNLNKFNYSPELCGMEICSIPMNTLLYFYYQCIEAN